MGCTSSTIQPLDQNIDNGGSSNAFNNLKDLEQGNVNFNDYDNIDNINNIKIIKDINKDDNLVKLDNDNIDTDATSIPNKYLVRKHSLCSIKIKSVAPTAVIKNITLYLCPTSIESLFVFSYYQLNYESLSILINIEWQNKDDSYLNTNCCILNDHTKNLTLFEPIAIVKYLNNINIDIDSLNLFPKDMFRRIDHILNIIFFKLIPAANDLYQLLINNKNNLKISSWKDAINKLDSNNDINIALSKLSLQRFVQLRRRIKTIDSSLFLLNQLISKNPYFHSIFSIADVYVAIIAVILLNLSIDIQKYENLFNYLNEVNENHPTIFLSILKYFNSDNSNLIPLLSLNNFKNCCSHTSSNLSLNTNKTCLKILIIDDPIAVGSKSFRVFINLMMIPIEIETITIEKFNKLLDHSEDSDIYLPR